MLLLVLSASVVVLGTAVVAKVFSGRPPVLHPCVRVGMGMHDLLLQIPAWNRVRKEKSRCSADQFADVATAIFTPACASQQESSTSRLLDSLPICVASTTPAKDGGGRS
ncbi:unnamed protein product [Phytophthora fragariaefolia]|uniref:Unnamed protein product n=1 Tax=Phytophthora fragariaefolia TaxID=1490495 RepID=A0A9W6YL10_9STRA|nr:unnamed protein product [Phytophthora fragariaefolia]